jgi:ABC-type Fe3+ transport system permease subunit
MEKRSIEIKWSILFTLAMLLWMYGEKLFGLHDDWIEKHAFYSGFFAIVAIAIYLFALYDKRKNYYNGFMDWREGFISGLYLTLFIVILSPLTQYVISRFISPEFFPNIIRYSVETGEMTRDQAQDHFSLKNYIITSAVFAVISGVITSAIAALLMRKRKKRA